jgi:hypothetical protein
MARFSHPLSVGQRGRRRKSGGTPGLRTSGARAVSPHALGHEGGPALVTSRRLFVFGGRSLPASALRPAAGARRRRPGISHPSSMARAAGAGSPAARQVGKHWALGRFRPMRLATTAGRHRSPVVGYPFSAGARCRRRRFGRQRERGADGPVSAIRHRGQGRPAPEGRRRARAASIRRPRGFAPCAWSRGRPALVTSRRLFVFGGRSLPASALRPAAGARRRRPGISHPSSMARAAGAGSPAARQVGKHWALGRFRPMRLATTAGRRRSPVVGYPFSAGARCRRRRFGRQRERGADGPVSAIRHRGQGRPAPEGRRRARAASIRRPRGFAPCAWSRGRAGAGHQSSAIRFRRALVAGVGASAGSGSAAPTARYQPYVIEGQGGRRRKAGGAPDRQALGARAVVLHALGHDGGPAPITSRRLSVFGGRSLQASALGPAAGARRRRPGISHSSSRAKVASAGRQAARQGGKHQAPARFRPMRLVTRAGRRWSPVVGYPFSAGARCRRRRFGRQRERGTDGPVSAIRHRGPGRQAPEGGRQARAASVWRLGRFAPCAWSRGRAGAGHQSSSAIRFRRALVARVGASAGSGSPTPTARHQSSVIAGQGGRRRKAGGGPGRQASGARAVSSHALGYEGGPAPVASRRLSVFGGCSLPASALRPAAGVRRRWPGISPVIGGSGRQAPEGRWRAKAASLWRPGRFVPCAWPRERAGAGHQSSAIRFRRLLVAGVGASPGGGSAAPTARYQPSVIAGQGGRRLAPGPLRSLRLATRAGRRRSPVVGHSFSAAAIGRRAFGRNVCRLSPPLARLRRSPSGSAFLPLSSGLSYRRHAPGV